MYAVVWEWHSSFREDIVQEACKVISGLSSLNGNRFFFLLGFFASMCAWPCDAILSHSILLQVILYFVFIFASCSYYFQCDENLMRCDTPSFVPLHWTQIHFFSVSRHCANRSLCTLWSLNPFSFVSMKWKSVNFGQWILTKSLNEWNCHCDIAMNRNVILTQWHYTHIAEKIERKQTENRIPRFEFKHRHRFMRSERKNNKNFALIRRCDRAIGRAHRTFELCNDLCVDTWFNETKANDCIKIKFSLTFLFLGRFLSILRTELQYLTCACVDCQTRKHSIRMHHFRPQSIIRNLLHSM